jgi:DDE superfamily endonuclease
VFIDETGIHLGMTRRYGRAPIGERLYDSEVPGDSGKNISLIGGLSLDGLIATMSVVGSVNTNVFLYYIQEILIPQLWVGAIVVMDNLSVHHAAVVHEALEAVGAKVVFPDRVVLVKNQATFAFSESSKTGVARPSVDPNYQRAYL